MLNPGGRFAVSDVLADPDIDDATGTEMQAYTAAVLLLLENEMSSDLREMLVTIGGSVRELPDRSLTCRRPVAPIVRAGKHLL